MSVPSGASQLDGLVGRTLPGGAFAVPGYEDWLMRDVCLGEPSFSSTLHPLSVFAACQRSIGLSLEEFFELCGSSSSEGPMLGETRIEVLRPVATGRHYAVRAAVTAAERKVGRTAGTIDIVELTMEAADDGGAVVARVVNSYIFRRSGT